MKILVTVKRVEDYESKIKVKPDNSWIVTEGVNYRANPFDEIAVEEALRVRDANAPSEVVAVSIGSGAAQAEIRSALAMGADRGILVKHDGFLDSDAVARLLQKVVAKEKPDLVLMGKQAVDVDDNVTGQLLAELLGWGQATFASKKESLESAEEKAKKPGLRLGADKKSLQVAREAGAVRCAEQLRMLEQFFVRERPPLPVAPLGHVHDDHVRMQLRVLRARQLVLKRRCDEVAGMLAMTDAEHLLARYCVPFHQR